MPTNTMLVPTVPVDVGVWSMGSFRLKGVAELIRVVQVLPLSLKYRMEHLPRGTLNKVGHQMMPDKAGESACLCCCPSGSWSTCPGACSTRCAVDMFCPPHWAGDVK